MSARTLSLLIGLSIPAGLVGCGDDDPGPPDAPPAPTFKGFDADEGGELRVEYVRRADGMANARATAFLFDNAGTTKYFPYPNLNGCTNSSTDMNWPVATNPIAERTYLNIGNVVISGGPQPLTIPPNPMAGRDPFGRDHPAGQWNFKPAPAMGNDAVMYLPEKTAFDVEFTGSANLPRQVFDNVLYMPADFQLVPAQNPPYPVTQIPANQPLTLSWQKVEANAPEGYEVQSLVAFTGANGPAVLCIEPDDGSITVPAEFINIARAAYPNGGTLARQTLTHVVRELEDNNGKTGKRIDFISVWCYATSFQVPQ